MRTLFFPPAVGLVAALLASPPVASQGRGESVDLLGRDLKDWTRLGVGKNPWRLTAERTLVCAPAHDAYTPDNEFWDGTVEFEYRFRYTGEKTGYKASVSVRRTPSTGCKVALGDNCGTVTGSFTGSSDKVKDVESRPPEPVGKPVGEWNQVRIQMKGRSVNIDINGKPAGSFDQCDLTHGLVVFESEGSEVEFRQIRWKASE